MRHYLSLAALMLLAACGGAEQSAGNDSAAAGSGDAAAKAAGVSLSPGEWEMTTEMLEMNVPGMPAGAMPKEAMQKSSVKICLTPEQVEQPDASFFSGQKNPNCTYEGFEMAAGSVTGTISCPGPDGTQKMAIAGRYAAQSYDLTMDMQSARMSMKMKTTGQRIGECPAPAAN